MCLKFSNPVNAAQKIHCRFNCLGAMTAYLTHHLFLMLGIVSKGIVTQYQCNA